MTDTRTYFDYRLRLQVPTNSPDRLLLEYIKNEQHLTYTEKEMVLAALRMCWLPLAYEQPDLIARREDLQRIALDAILRLREQIQYLAAIAGISQPQPILDPLINRAASTAPIIPSIESVRLQRKPEIASPRSHSIAASSLDGYEEDLFGDN